MCEVTPPAAAQAAGREEDKHNACDAHPSHKQVEEAAVAGRATAVNSNGTRPNNPLDQASFISRLFFMWPYSLLKLGMTRPLEECDLADVLPRDTSLYSRDYFLKMWNEECRLHSGSSPDGADGPSLRRAMLKDYLKSLWYIQPIYLVGETARVVQAVVLGFLIESFEGRNDNGYLWASIMVACGILLLLEHHHIFFFTWRKGMQMRASCVAAIHDKSLRLSSTHQDTSASYGRIMNLASNDVERLILVSLFINYLFWGPAQAVLILIVGIFLVGPAFAAGFALLVVVFVPLQFYLSGKFAYYRSSIAAITDQRVTFVSQAVRGARVMKMSGYEYRFLDRIQLFRAREIRQIAKANNLKALNEALFYITSPVISLVIFLVHVLGMGGTLQPGAVFTVFTLINVMQLELIKHLSLAVMSVSEGK